jgi:hypothetical protein
MVAIYNVLEIDLTVVARPGGERSERYISLGLHWQTQPFLP